MRRATCFRSMCWENGGVCQTGTHGVVVLFHSGTSLEIQFQDMFFLMPFCTTKIYVNCTPHSSVFIPMSTNHIPFSKVSYSLPWQSASDHILGVKINGKNYEHVITFSSLPKTGKNLQGRNPETKGTFYHSWQRDFQWYNNFVEVFFFPKAAMR